MTAAVARRYEPTSPQNPLDVPWNGITLAGHDLLIIPEGTAIRALVQLHWHTEVNITEAYTVQLDLLDAAGNVLINHTSIPAEGERPTSTWLVGEWLLDEHVLTVPLLPPGTYQLRLTLLDANGAPVTTEADEPFVILQDIQTP